MRRGGDAALFMVMLMLVIALDRVFVPDSALGRFRVRQCDGLLVRRRRLAARIVAVWRLPQVIVARMVVVCGVLHVHRAAAHVVDTAANVTVQ